MDVNGLRSFGLAYGQGLHGWAVPEAGVTVQPAWQHLVTGVALASRLPPLALTENAADADAVTLSPSMVVDALGNHLHWDGDALVSTSHLQEQGQGQGLLPLSFALPPEARPVTDMTLGDDDLLMLSVVNEGGAALWLADLRGRFPLTRFAAPEGFAPQRLAACPGGGVWALDTGTGRLMRSVGLPPFEQPVHVGRDRNDRLEACPPEPHPLHWQTMAATLPADERGVALASSADGPLLLLSLHRPAGGMRLRRLLDDGRWSLPLTLQGPRFGHTLGWLDGERIAVATRGSLEGGRDPGVWTYALPAALWPRWAEASDVDATTLPSDLALPLAPLGDFHPLAGWTGGPFANGRPSVRLHYPRQRGDALGLTRVARVSGAARARYGVVANVPDQRVPGARMPVAAGLLDTRDGGTVWHRLYAEAVLPEGCAMLVWLATSDTGPPAFDAGAPTRRAGWHPHLIGARGALPPDVLAELPTDLPRAAWVPQPTEVAHGQPVLVCAGDAGDAGDAEARRGKAGLFTVLIQRAGLTVRTLQGRRLWVTVELFGDGRATPELVALRAWAGRLSYRDRYLPALYHETVFGTDANRSGRATGADFLDRLLHLFEGPLTDIEGRIAASALMTDPRACPPDALPWLAGWVGLALQPGMAVKRQRDMLANAATLARQHGTLAGLQRALDIATDGGVTRGRLVIVEDFRLRRTLATILGARLTDAGDPLTQGIAVSGNSVVGDALFLGEVQALDEDQVPAFLALFRELEGANHEAAQRALYDGLAYRATVLVHETASADELGLVQQLAALSAPAHVLLRVTTAAYPLMVGVASLIGADTFLRAPPPARPVRIGPGPQTSALGSVDRLQGQAVLDAHAGALAGVLPPLQSAAPQARARVEGSTDNPFTTVNTQPFTLDGSESEAGAGRAIASWTWTHFPPPNP